MFWILNSGTALCCAQAVAVECGFYASYDLLSIQLVKLISFQEIQKKWFISSFDIGKPYFESLDDEQADGWFSFQTLLNGRICSESRNLLSKPNPIKILYVHILQH